jgi:NAD(P)-dependent dehydrogenase (short-subunit alcohol dehydrogenase family)
MNKPRLAGRVALITGGGGGIGLAAAQLFAREGAKVAIAEVDPERGERAAAQVVAQGGDALFVATDVTQEASVAAAVAAAERAFGKLDVLFCCAGGSIEADAPLGKVDVASVWDKTMRLDLLGTIHCCHHVIPAIVRAGGGTVINMSSGAALRGASPAHIYSTAKGGILALTQALAGTYARSNVRVNAICAGRILTERILARFGTPEAPTAAEDQQADSRIKEYPFWVGKPEDIANIALFLASDESRMITGAAIPADGGRSAY